MPATAALEVVAPLSGVVVPLDAVPDPVFSRRMVGDGLAIDPISSDVLAPVAGVISQFHAAHHAFAITTADGVEVLVHVGLDTVTLAGAGFTPLARLGDRVALGQPVLHLDLEALARQARSLLTIVLITNGGRIATPAPARALVEAGRSSLFTCHPAGAPQASAASGALVLSASLAVTNAHGLHARPAAVLAAEARRFTAAISLLRGADRVDARSVVSVLGLSVAMGERIQFEAAGPDAAEAVAAMAAAIEAGCGEVAGAAEAEGGTEGATARLPSAGQDGLAGVPASPGLVVGRVLQHRHAAIEVTPDGAGLEVERARLAAALCEAARRIDALKQHVGDPGRAQLLEVQIALLEDPVLAKGTEALLVKGRSAAFAWREAYVRHAIRLEALESPVMRERAADLRDVGTRVLALLAGVGQAKLEAPEGTVLVADELTPSEVAGLDRSRILALCTTTGGSTSHVAILARSLGIPAVVGLDEAVLALAGGTEVVVDGTLGLVQVAPDAGSLARARRAAAEGGAAQDEPVLDGPARTRDGHRVELCVNVRDLAETRQALSLGAEGVGLLRSEYLFLDRDQPPDEDEQAAAYGGIAEALGKDRRFVLRTLDMGGDKPLRYHPMPKEQNPFLGMRGIRVSLEAPALFRVQLRAALRAATVGNLHLMFPMVSSIEEVRAAKQILAEEQRTVQRAVKVGVMVEVPSAVVIVELLAREVDFFSIGTNDLTQYTLATDRGHPKLARQADALHPAVLRLIAMTVEGAHEFGKWVGVCGGLASEPLAVPLLVGLGVDELSVAVPMLRQVRATLSRWELQACADLASDALLCRTTADVRALLAQRAEELAEVSARRLVTA